MLEGSDAKTEIRAGAPPPFPYDRLAGSGGVGEPAVSPTGGGGGGGGEGGPFGEPSLPTSPRSGDNERS